LLLILALAYLLLCGIGLMAQSTLQPGVWCANSKPGTCTVFAIGHLLQKKTQASAAQAFAAFLRASVEAVPTWA
jgi:hypothetical protein